MFIGERIYSSITRTSYTIFHTFKAGGQAEVAYATSDKSSMVFFIKRLLNIKYSSNKKVQKECLEFEKNRRNIYEKINVLTIEGASCTYVNDFFREGPFYYVVTVKIDGFNLQLDDISKYLTLGEKLFLLKTMVYSFYPLEQQKIIHGDIKPENFIIKRVNNHFVAKMVDLESSFMIDFPPEKGYVVGTEPYYSPELVNYNNENNTIGAEVLTTKSDIFSLGIIFYEVLAGKYPGKGKYVFEQIKDNECITYPTNWPKELSKLIKAMLHIDPQKRPNIETILNVLKGISNETLATNEIHPPYVKVEPTADHNAKVHIYSLQKDSKILYSLDGAKYIEYSEPIWITDDDIHLKLKVTKGNETSSVKYFRHIISASINRAEKVCRPTISIDNKIVTITCKTPSANIHYSIDGSLPTKSSPQYSSAFNIADNTTIKVIAYRKGMYCSDIVSLNSSSKIKIS